MQNNERGDSSVLSAIFTQNAWANLKLLGFCKGLSDAQLDTAAIGGYGSIRDTLLHIVGAEVSYVVRVNGRLPARPFARNQFPGFEVLEDAVRWASVELLELALSAREGAMVRERPPNDGHEYPLASLIAQAIGHSTEHRAQIAAILTQLDMKPPDMSGWCYMQETGEYRDLGGDQVGA